ncbi:MAG: tetratricopeptide repeat protein [Polyangiales bacterium]
MLGPRLRRLSETGTHGGPFTTTARLEVAADAEERTQVYPGGPARPRPEREGSVDDATAQSEPKTERPPRARTDEGRPLFGQPALVAAIRQALESAFPSGKPVLLAVQGAPGSGKTAALQRASEIAAELQPELAVHYAALRSRDDGPYAPFSRLLLDRFGITPASSPSSVREDMERSVAEALGAPERAAETAQLLGHVTGVPFPESHLLRELQGDPAALHSQAIAAVARFGAGDARRSPLLWLLDDLTDAEPFAWELLSALLDQDAPLVVIATGRQPLLERVRELHPQARVQGAELAPLDAAATSQLVRMLVPDLQELPEELVSALLHRGGGNPRQLVELLRALQDGGLFRREPHGVIVDLPRLERGGLPLTMADSIRARLVTLGAAELQVMRDAAVVGERFWDGTLLALRRARGAVPDADASALELWTPSDDELELQQTLDALEAKGFIVGLADSPVHGLGEYTFQYAGTRSLIYVDLPEAERSKNHAVVARWLAATSNLPVENPAALLASHLEHGGNRELAARAYLRAADNERARMRTTMALLYVDRALPLIGEGDVGTRMDALHERGSLLGTLGRYPEALLAFQEIARLSWLLGARGRGGAALNRIARIHRERGEHELALEHLQTALAIFQGLGDQRGVASSYDDMAQIHRMQGHLDAALAAAKEALEIRSQTQDRRAQALSLNTIGRIELDLGAFDAAEARFKRALEVREALADHEGAVQTRVALGQLAFRAGRPEQAIPIYLEALEAARELNHQRFQGYLLNYLGAAYLARDELDPAEKALREAKKLATSRRDQYALADIEHNLVLLARKRNEAGTSR